MRLRAWPWLAAIVVISAGVRIALGRHVIAPWIMVDELIYSELAKSFAASGHFRIRGVPSNGYGFVYPVLIAPAWKLFGPMPTVYAFAKAINAVVMSLAAVPAYLLARRVVSPGLSLCAAVLAVAIPPMLYTSELMTENVFYPLFLLVCWALVATLERPTALRQVGVLALCGVAFATRQQAVALVPAVAIAPVLLGWFERRVKAQLRAWVTTYAILVAGAILVLGGTVARGRSPLSLLGAYRAATSIPYSVTSILHYLLWHVAELDLALGVIPFAALFALWLAPRTAPAFVAATLPITVLLVVEVAIFASTQSGRIEERNMFYVMPFGLVALLAFVQRDVLPRRSRTVLLAALVAGVLPVAIPLRHFVGTPALSDTFALMPWWWIQDRGITFDTLRWVALLVALVAAALFVVVPRRHAMALVALVALYFVLTSAVVQNGRHGIVQASRGSLFAGIHKADYDWVDRAVGRHADVTILWNNVGPIQRVWLNEFFNRSIKHYTDTGNVFTGGLPEQPLTLRDNGELATASGKPATAHYALASQTAYLAGKTIATDQGTGMAVIRVDGPLVVLVKVTGLYPTDTWSGRHVRYFRRQCTGGLLSVQLQSDDKLFVGTTQTVSSGAHSIALPPTTDIVPFLVPLVHHADNTCTADFTVAKLRVPAKVEPGSADTRELGVHFLHFSYLP